MQDGANSRQYHQLPQQIKVCYNFLKKLFDQLVKNLGGLPLQFTLDQLVHHFPK